MNTSTSNNPLGRVSKWVAALLAVAAVGAVLFYALEQQGGKQATVQEKQPTEISLRLKWIKYAGWAGELVAKERGYWSKRGLDVTLKRGGFELDPIRLVASGSDDIGVAGANQILLAREKGLPLVAFAVQYQQAPVGFVSKEGSGVNSLEDFPGHTIGIKPGTDVHLIYQALMNQHDISREELDEVPVKFDLAPFYEGQVDIYPGYTTSDLLLPEENDVSINLIRAVDNNVSVYGNVYFTRRQYLENNTKDVVKFLNGVRQGWVQAFDMPDDSIASLALDYNSSLNTSHERRVASRLDSYILPENTKFGEMTREGWNQLHDLLLNQGVLEESVDVGKAYTKEILKRSNYYE